MAEQKKPPEHSSAGGHPPEHANKPPQAEPKVEMVPGPQVVKKQDLHLPIKPVEPVKGYDPSQPGAVNKRSSLEPGHTDPNTGETAPMPKKEKEKDEPKVK